MQRFKTMEIGGKIVMEFNLSEKRKKLREGCAMLKRSEILDEIEEQDKEFIKRLKEEVIIDTILWARQWAEYVEDDKILEMWREEKKKEILSEKAGEISREIRTIDKLAGENLK